jgi:signal peptidase I
MNGPDETIVRSEQQQEAAATAPVEAANSSAPALAPAEQPQAAAPAPRRAATPAQGPVGIQFVLSVLVIVMFLITFVVQAFRVPSESMETTLLTGDFLLADKVHFADGGKVWQWLMPYRPIHRGDIIVFHYPVDPSQYFVKRVIGLPGDHIHLENKTVFINGTPQEEAYVNRVHSPFDYYRDNFPTSLFRTNDIDRRWWREIPKHLDGGDLVVPAGEYFVMGDNRDRSLDSRYWGFVPQGSVTGRPLVIYLSVTDGGEAEGSSPNDKLIHSGQLLAHLLQFARWGRMFRLVR